MGVQNVAEGRQEDESSLNFMPEINNDLGR